MTRISSMGVSRKCLLFIAIVLFTGLLLSPAASFSFESTKSYVNDPDEKPPKVEPYLLGFTGIQDARADAYEQVFDQPFMRYGGGFGLRMRNAGAEVVVRKGTNKQVRKIEEIARNFSLDVTELQVRFYGIADYKLFSFPAGIGVGLIDITVDRGYPGSWDRFSGDGFFVGPFMAVEFRPVKAIAIGIEVEYSISEAEFSSSEAWDNQFNDDLQGQFPTNNVTEASFWDTVGGSSKEKYDSGGFIICLRARFTLPTYSGNKE